MAARRRPSTRRRKSGGDGFLVKLLIPIALLVVLGVVAYLVLRPTASGPVAQPTPPACPPVPDVVVGQLSVPAGPIGGFCQAELVNAASIILAAQHWHLNRRAVDIGVMTAIGESGLRNLTYGDAAGPDSRGIFQQRSNYGPVSRRMNPYSAAYDFFARMRGVANWRTRPPTEVAHLVQINANPDYYTPYFPRAEIVVDGLFAHHRPPALTYPVPALPQPNS